MNTCVCGAAIPKRYVVCPAHWEGLPQSTKDAIGAVYEHQSSDWQKLANRVREVVASHIHRQARPAA